jgi:signal peptidase I
VAPDPFDPAALAVDTPTGSAGAPAPPVGPAGPEHGGATPSRPEPTRHGSSARWIREIVVIAVVAVLLAVLLRTFVIQTFFIPSGSMEPTLQIGDRILVDKLAYHLHSVHRGDIVVFSRPPAEDCGGPEVNDLVKRVIGLPGDTVSLSGRHVYIDGKRLDESWLPGADQGVTQVMGNPPYDLAHPYRVPAGEYYVMGDNRTDSCDSRYWGPITKSLIVGKVDVRVWPIGSFRFF